MSGTAPATMPAMLAANARQWPAAIAAREKHLGIWKEYTWQQCCTRAAHITLGMQAQGVAKGDVVGLLGQNRLHWVLAQIAAHACGAMSLGIYKESLRDEVAYLLDYCSARVVFVEDEEQADKLIELGGRIGSVKHIVYADPRGMRKYDDPRLLSLAALCKSGAEALERDSRAFERLAAAADPEAVAILCTTSGTTSHPKPAMLQGGAFLGHARALLEVEPKDENHQYASVLPLPWIGEQVALGQWLIARFPFNFPEEDETAAQDMREIGPTTLLWPPRAWEALAAQVKANMMDASPLKRALYAVGMRLGLAAVKSKRRSTLGELIVGRALRDRFGLRQLRYATTGGAPLGPEVFRFFRAIGVPLRQVYGQTELCGIYCTHDPAEVDYDTVGKPLPGVQLRIEQPDRQGMGEIVVRHPGMFTGYFGNEAATGEAVREGWMHTGDAGYVRPDGQLVVVDRVSDLATLKGGDRFSPQFIENKLKFSPHIGECVVLGHGRPYIAAMLCIRYSIVSKWAEKRRIAFTTYSDLSGRPEVQELLLREVQAVNATLPASQRIRRFLLLYKELDADDGELTRTRKVRRNVIHERYEPLIGALYSEAGSVAVDASITLQDGRQTRIRTNLAILDALAREAA
jgi:long-chain acyl-CoA synthetase